MIAHRKETFLRLCRLLRKIESNKDNLEAVKELNISLIKQIMSDEKRVKRIRNCAKELRRRLKNDRPSKERANLIRNQIAKCERIVDKFLDQIYIWRCIGDGLAYAYIDTINMKHVLFDTSDYSVKPESGFITGKDGLVQEVAELLDALKNGVPAVLCDITNTIRYGDVCLLGAADPYPFEVKSPSSKNNQRAKRQAAKLAKLQKFLDDDIAWGFRGSPIVQRQATPSKEPHDCIEQMNVCIESARDSGYSILCPEPGLIYVAINGEIDISVIFENRDMKHCSVFILNSEKTAKSWVPYLPFVTSIRDVDALFDFIAGNLMLLVLIDNAYLCKQMEMPGWRVSLINHPTMMLLFEHEDDGPIAISSLFYGRLGLEFMSLRWFVDHYRLTISEAINHENLQTVSIPMEVIKANEEMLKHAPRYFN